MKSTHIILASGLLALGVGWFWMSSSRDSEGQKEVSGASAKASAQTQAPQPTQNARWKSLTDPSISWQLRVDMLRREKNLSASDVDALLVMLAHTSPADGEKEAWWVVLNEIMEQLRVRGAAPEDFTHALIAVMGDSSADEVARDYAVQHLSQWIAPRDPALPREENPARAADALSAMSALVQDERLAHSSVPGTVLMALADVRGTLQGDEENPLATQLASVIVALEPWLGEAIAGRRGISLANRTSAINAVALFELKNHRPALLSLAQTETENPSARLCSVAALGSLGTQDDIPFLEQIASGDSKFRYAARTALQKIDKQNSSAPSTTHE